MTQSEPDRPGPPPRNESIVLHNHRAVQDVLHLARRIIADGSITLDEGREFIRWVEQHPQIAVVPPVPLLARRLRGFVADGVLDRREQAEVLIALRQLVGQDAPGSAS